MFLTCRNFCGQTERQHELVVYETLSGENPAMMARKDIVELSQLATDRPMVYSKLVKSAHDSIKKELYSAKKQFTDAEFPPNAKSLGHYHDPREKKIVWKRLPQIVQTPILIGSIDPVDIMQGNFGDCYFMSSLAALAEDPQRIRNIFADSEVNPCGIFRARVCVAGVAKEVLIDDYFPVFEQNNQPVFARPRENQVWLMVIEKIWAKLSGSYNRISSNLQLKRRWVSA